MKILDRFSELHSAIGDPVAAAILVLAEVVKGRPEYHPEIALNVTEAANRLRVSKATVYELVSNGKLVAHRVGCGRGAIRITPAEIERYQKESVPEPKQPTGHRLTLAEFVKC